MRNLLLTILLTSTFSAPGLSQEEKAVPEIHYPRHSLGIGISVTGAGGTPRSYLDYYYRLDSKRLIGYSLDYIVQWKVVGLHTQARFTNYAYTHSTYKDRRHSTYQSDWSRTYHYNVTMLSVDQTLILQTKGEMVKGVAEFGVEINTNIAGSGTYTAWQWTAPPNYSESTSEGSANNWDSNIRFQGLFKIGGIGNFNRHFGWSCLLRLGAPFSFNFIPIDGIGFIATLNFGVHYSF